MAVKVKEIKSWLESRFPPTWAEDWDHIGLQVGDPDQRVERIGITLEATPRSVSWAVGNDLQLLISHHPLFFTPFFSLAIDSEPGRTASQLVKADLSLLVAHTNLDASPEGVSTALARRLGVTDLQPLEKRSREKVKVVFYIPSGYEEKIMAVLGELEAGRIGSYQLCTFKCRGEGTFLAQSGSHPFLGEIGRLQRVGECRLEVLIDRVAVGKVIRTISKIHPYEEMAYDVYPVEHLSSEVGLGRFGYFDPPISGETLLLRLKQEVEAPSVRVSGIVPTTIRKIAVCGGSGGSLIPEALSAGAEMLICGEIGYHPIVSCQGQGLTLVEIGHYPSEKWVLPVLAEILRTAGRSKGWEVEVLENRESGDPYSHYF